jgi:hypothetical protein
LFVSPSIQKKFSGYDLITGQILKELPIIGTKYLTQLLRSNGSIGYNLLALKLKLIYDRQSVGQSVLVSGGGRLGPVTNFSFSLKLPLDSCGFVIL